MKTKKKLGCRRLTENRPAQRDSKMYKWGVCQTSPTSLTSLTNPQGTPAQRHSKICKLGVCPISPTSPNTPVERHSKMCKSSENSSDQRNSKFSNLGNRPLSLFSPFSPLAPQNRPAQRDSKFSNGQLSSIGIRIKTCFLCNYLKINDFFKLFCLGNYCIMLTYRLYSYLEDYNSYQFEIGASRRRIISLCGFLFFGER